jgi:phosphoglycerate dehydrogenase-like enzyme
VLPKKFCHQKHSRKMMKSREYIWPRNENVRESSWKRGVESMGTEEGGDQGQDRKGDGEIALEAGIGEIGRERVGHAGEGEVGRIIVAGVVEAVEEGEIGVQRGVNRKTDREKGAKAANTKDNFLAQKDQLATQIPKTGKARNLLRKLKTKPKAQKRKFKC